MTATWSKRLLSGLLCLSLTGCYAIVHDVDMADPAIAPGSTTRTRQVHAETRSWYLMSGLVPLSGEPQSAALERAINGKGELTHVRIKSEMTPVDFLISFGGGLALGLVGYAVAGNSSQYTAIAPMISLLSLFVVPSTRTITYDGELIETVQATNGSVESHE